MKNKRSLRIGVGTFLLLAVLYGVYANARARSYEKARFLAFRAEDYRDRHGEWATNLVSLCADAGISANQRDGFGHLLIFEPYSNTERCGRVISYGLGGNPGGRGIFGDITVKYPLADWATENATSFYGRLFRQAAAP